MVPPDLAFCPLWPLPAVLPLPEPGPLPTRLRPPRAPAAGERSLSESFESSLIAAIHLFHGHQMPHPSDHAPDRRVVLLQNHILVVTQAKSPERLTLGTLALDAALYLTNS